MLRKSPPESLHAQSADGPLRPLRNQGDFPVSQIKQILRHLFAFQPVIHRDVGKLHPVDLIRHIDSDSTENERHFQLPYLFFRMFKFSAKKNNAAQPFLLLQLQRHVNLVFLRLHMPEHKRVLVPLCLFLDDLDHAAEKGIRDSLHQYRNAFCVRPL